MRSTRDVPSRRQICRRDTRPSRRLELGRYLWNIDRAFVDQAPDCESKLEFLINVIMNGFDTMMPVRHSQVHHGSHPSLNTWSSSVNLLLPAKGDLNVTIPILSKWGQPPTEVSPGENDSAAPKWKTWNNPIQVGGGNLSSISRVWNHPLVEILCFLQTDEIDGLDDHAAANLINTAFLDPMKAYQKINTLPSVLPSSTSHRPPLTLSEVDVLPALTELSSKKPGRWPRWNSMLGAQRVCWCTSSPYNCYIE